MRHRDHTNLPDVQDTDNQSPALTAEEKRQLRRSSYIKIAALIGFVAAIMAYSTIAWFTENRTTSAQGAGVRVNDIPGYDADYRAFRYRSDSQYEGCVEISTFDTTAENGLYTNQYDTIFTERNQFTGVLLRIEVTGKPTANSNVKLQLVRDAQTDPTATYISEVSGFQCAAEGTGQGNCALDRYLEDDAQNRPADLNGLWTTARTFFSTQNVLHFAQNATTLDLITLTLPANDSAVVWVLMDYDNSRISQTPLSLNQADSIEVVHDCDVIQIVPAV